MIVDGDLDALLRKPKNARAFIKKSLAKDAPESQARSFGIKGIYFDVDYVLRAGRPPEQLPLGFLQAEGHIVGQVKRVRRMKVGDEIVQWNEYNTEDDFYYGPPSAFRSERVAEINQALAQVSDEWVRTAYNVDDLTSEAERGRLTAADYDARIQWCQEAVRELKVFIARAASAEMGLLRYLW
jgi:hypothetical protein